MPTVRLVPSTYTLSNTSYLTISNAANMYTNVDSTTMATINHNRSATTAYYVYVKGFNFNSIPIDATINSAVVKIKAYESGASAVTPVLSNNTTSLNVNLSGTITTSAQTRTVDITNNWNTYKGYGNNFGIRLSLNRSNKNTASRLYIYGAEIEVTYTEYVPPSEVMHQKVNGAWTQLNVSAVYKKVNGVWIQQTDMASSFDPNAKYVKGG